MANLYNPSKSTPDTATHDTYYIREVFEEMSEQIRIERKEHKRLLKKLAKKLKRRKRKRSRHDFLGTLVNLTPAIVSVGDAISRMKR